MIVWVNGAFGSGKTTLVEELRSRRPEALVYDPEMVGYVLREIVDVPTGDFQDLRLWRRQVAELAVGLVEEYGRPLLVPMTLVNPEYVEEIFSTLRKAGITVHHFFLRVPPEVLEQRIDGRSFTPDDPERDERVRRWCKSKIPSCMAFLAEVPADAVVLNGELSPRALADQVLNSIRVVSAPRKTPQPTDGGACAALAT
ncbi:AAA family ATPase [Streptomyces sp. KM273126]|uniref:AAA family ATPase n=1 Tax=Streptomyces sp. KM273126 TaxID=2545247 RepID=UPI00103D864F|nr:AAA family ATPase [Streptomyces sp. KM273126]MBA2806979.1 AAA family ATPase [Streptomyces sp. KM273126]